MARLIGFFSRFFRSQVAARTRRELHQLSNHRLRDLGLNRDQIDALFR